MTANQDSPVRTTIPPMAWVILVLMTADYVLGMIDRNAVSILKTTLKGVFQIDDAQYGLLVTAFMVPYAIFYVISGSLVDRYGPKIMLTVFVVIWSLATVGAGLSNSFTELLIWRAVLGAAEAGLVPATVLTLIIWFPRDRIATAYAVKTPLYSLGPIISAPLIAALALNYGWRSAFIVPGALGFLMAAVWWFAYRNPPSYPPVAEDSAPKLTWRQLLTTRVLWGLMVVRFVTDGVWFFFQYWQAGYMQEVLGASLADVGRLLWIPPAVNAVMVFFTGRFSDRMIQRGVPRGRSRLLIIQAVTVLAPLMLLMPFVGLYGFVFLLTTTSIMTFTWLYMSNILVSDFLPKRSVGVAVGLVNCVGTAGAAFFNLAVGPVVEAWGYMPIFICCALLHPIALVLLRLFYRDQLSGRQGEIAQPAHA